MAIAIRYELTCETKVVLHANPDVRQTTPRKGMLQAGKPIPEVGEPFFLTHAVEIG